MVVTKWLPACIVVVMVHGHDGSRCCVLQLGLSEALEQDQQSLEHPGKPAKEGERVAIPGPDWSTGSRDPVTECRVFVYVI